MSCEARACTLGNPGSRPASGQSVPMPGMQAKLTMAERRALMDSFVRDAWLISTPDAAGRYSIGVREMMCSRQSFCVSTR